MDYSKFIQSIFPDGFMDREFISIMCASGTSYFEEVMDGYSPVHLISSLASRLAYKFGNDDVFMGGGCKTKIIVHPATLHKMLTSPSICYSGKYLIGYEYEVNLMIPVDKIYAVMIWQTSSLSFSFVGASCVQCEGIQYAIPEGGGYAKRDMPTIKGDE